MSLTRLHVLSLVAACVLLPLHVPQRVCVYVLMAFARIAGFVPAELVHVALFWGLHTGGWQHGGLAVLNFRVLHHSVQLKVSRENAAAEPTRVARHRSCRSRALELTVDRPSTVVLQALCYNGNTVYLPLTPYNIHQFMGIVSLVTLTHLFMGAPVFNIIEFMLSGHRTVFLNPCQEQVMYNHLMNIVAVPPPAAPVAVPDVAVAVPVPDVAAAVPVPDVAATVPAPVAVPPTP